MKRLLATLVTAICGVGLLSLYLVPTAEAAPYTPKAGANFNNSSGSKAAERRLQTDLDRAISATPRGSTITMAMYLFNQGSSTDRLIAAHRRGVNVQFLIDDGANTSQLRKLKKVLGTNKRARSFVAKCKRSCMSNTAGSSIHVKYYLFTRVGRATNVSIISSANPHGVNIHNSFNNSQTIVNNPAIYRSLRKYFTDMLLDKTNLSYFRGTRSGAYTVYYYPRRPVRIHYLDVLKSVRCRTAKNMGSKGRTVVRLGMWGFTNPRMDVARKLWSLHNAGCKVDVTLNRGRASRTVMRQLLVKSKRYGQMLVEDAWKDKNRNDYAESYIHHKELLVNGWVEGRNQRLVYTGSQNLTGPGSLFNDDIVLRIADSRTYFAYSKNLSYVQKKSKRLRSTPPPIKLKSKRHDGRALTADQYVEQRANAEDGG